MNRPVRVVAVLLAAALALTTVAGCGRLRDRADDSTELSWDAQALASIGYSTDDLGVTDATADATDDRGPAPGLRGRHPRLRFVFRHALHGEATVETDEGLKTVVAQRGTVTEVTSTTVTVSSTDGFALTWQITDRTVVVVQRAKAEIGDVAVGTEVGVAGARDGDAVNARLVVVPRV